MVSKSTILSNVRLAYFRRLVVLPLVVLFTVSAAPGQSPTDNGTPLGLEQGAPAGSYSLSELEQINLFNGSLSFSFPAAQVGGRGKAGYSVQVPIQAKWTAIKNEWHDEVGNRFFSILPSYNPGAYLWGYGANYSAGSMSIRYSQWKPEYCNIGSEFYWTYRWARTTVVFTAPDGTEHELVDQGTLGQPINYPSCSLNGNSRGTTFVSRNDPGMTFISDTPIRDAPYWGPDRITGYLKMADGTVYRFGAIDHPLPWGSWHTPIISWVRDANGNKTTFVYTNDAYGDHLTSVKDSLNRELTFEYGVTEAPYGYIDRLTFKGYGGANRVVRISKGSLSTALRPGSTIQTLKQLFPELDAAEDSFDTSVITAIWLPDSDGVTRRYRFLYNSYAELARVELPTGGAIEYDIGAGLGNGASSGFVYPVPGAANPLDTELPQVYRRMLSRRTYDAGNVLLGTTNYGRPESQDPNFHSISNAGYVSVTQLGPAGEQLAVTNHFFYGSPATSLFSWESLPEFMPTHSPFAGYRDGHEYQTDHYAANGPLLRRVIQSWDQPAVYWWSGSSETAPANCPFVKESVSVLVDSGQVTKATNINPQTGQVMIDQFGNRTDEWVYDYGQGQPGALLRHSHTDFLTVNPVNGIQYTNRTSAASPHILNLPTRHSVYDALGTERARTTIEYDNYISDANHAPLMDRPGISGFDSSFSVGYATRGNVTASTSYRLENGSELGSISACSQFDIAGNVVKRIDPRGYATNVDFRDNFGASGDSVQAGGQPTNTPPAELAGLATYAFPFAVTNALGNTAYAKFDYHLGKSVVAEDANGIIFRGYFNDVLDRPTQVIRGANQAADVKNQTSFSYNDSDRVITATSDQQSYGDNLLKSQTVFDGLGRTIESRQYETASTYIAVRTVPFIVLQDGSNWLAASQASNPFRPYLGEQPIWTTSFVDSLGRGVKVRTPDNATVTNSYVGNTVTVTDPATRSRKTVADALGRLKEVYEDPAGSNYLTSYNYDALDNLVTVNQGGQPRTFAYDSLKRLTSATNPESGVVCYGNVVNSICQADGYDANGNLIHKTDARGIVTTYVYDALNRVTGRSYSDGTPSVNYAYDPNIANGKGRLSSVSSTVSTYTYGEYDALGQVKAASQTIGAQTYSMSYTYDLAGHVKTMNYPSGHYVSYNYDGAGRLADKDAQNLAFTGNLGGTPRTYLSGVSYAAVGGLQEEKFGTATPIYHKQRYNARGQLWDMRASTVSFATDPANGDRGAIINYYSNTFTQGGSGTDNNGNVLRQENYIPGSNFFQDNFGYDSFNRLSSLGEKLNGVGADTFHQMYGYDRWGNRTISSATGTGINNLAFEVDNGVTGTNRLYAPGDVALPDASRRMQYDQAGNLKHDTYTGQGVRTYDGENRMKQAWANNQWQTYAYDGEGKRVKRNANGTETWQVYGIGGELIAEYAQNAPYSSPQKEYGYRNGQLLITTETGTSAAAPSALTTTPPASGANIVLSWTAAQGAINYRVERQGAGGAFALLGATTSNTFTDSATSGSAYLYKVCAANGSGQCTSGYSNIALGAAVTFPTDPTIKSYSEDPANATSPKAAHINELRTAVNAIRSLAGLSTIVTPNPAVGDLINVNHVRDLRIKLSEGLNELGIQLPSYTDATLLGFVEDPLNATTIKAAHIRELRQAATTGTGGGGGSGGSSFQIGWVLMDHLGTPRMVFDQTGSLASVSRHDYMPFGEEVPANFRTGIPGYGVSDNVRQKFTGYEQDEETKLEFAQARYYSTLQGRFTSPDPWMASADLFEPQSWNRYSYVINNPLMFIDPLGLAYHVGGGVNDDAIDEFSDEASLSFQRKEKRKKDKKDKMVPLTATPLLETTLDPGVTMQWERAYAIQPPSQGVSTTFGPGSNGTGGGGDSNARIDLFPGLTAPLLGLDVSANVGEFFNVRNGTWRGVNGKMNSMSWGGNRWTGPRSAAVSAATGFKLLGRFVFVAGAVHSGYQVYQGNTTKTKAAFDIGFSAVGQAGIYGFGANAVYTGVDMTVGWPAMWKTMRERKILTGVTPIMY
jgi:RHS repeat-associated protein